MIFTKFEPLYICVYRNNIVFFMKFKGTYMCYQVPLNSVLSASAAFLCMRSWAREPIKHMLFMVWNGKRIINYLLSRLDFWAPFARAFHLGPTRREEKAPSDPTDRPNRHSPHKLKKKMIIHVTKIYETI